MQFLDIVSPEWLDFQLGIDIILKLFLEESRIMGGEFLELFQKLVGFEYAEIRQSDPVFLSRP